jgi:quercetin dioxygenase-like cupin family protein
LDTSAYRAFYLMHAGGNLMQTTHVVRRGTYPVLDVFGPTVEFLALPEETHADYCVMIGTIPPGVSVPLHSHPDPESFYLLSGTVLALSQRGDRFEWLDVKPGEFVHEPGGVKHAWQNASSEPAVSLITTSSRLGRFFLEIGKAVSPGTLPGPPTPDDLQRLMQVAAQYDYWMASPVENAAVGISLFSNREAGSVASQDEPL